MSKSAKVTPPNSIIFISDPNGGQAPYPVRGARILATPSCISVICYPEQDGPTEVTLGEVTSGDDLAFEGDLETPSRAVVVSTVEREVVLEVAVPKTLTHIRIWMNHPRWPDRIIVGLG